MNTILIFIWIYAAIIATSFWEAYVEGRNSWDKNKLGWKIKIGQHTILTAYHFCAFWLMWPLLLTLPFIIYGWNTRLFGIILSAYFSGMVLEDFVWYIANPAVKFKEFWTDFSDYYPWLKVKNRKIIPLGYVFGIILSVLSWYLFWK